MYGMDILCEISNVRFQILQERFCPHISWSHNYIFILELTPGFNGLGKTRQETFKCWDSVCVFC